MTPTDATPRASWTRWILPLVVTVVGVGALVYFLAPYSGDIGTAVDRAPAATLFGITALSLIALPLRTEVWRTGLVAADRNAPRSDLHFANSVSQLTSLASHYVAPAVKWWLLRRMEGERAAYMLKLATIDLATTVLEGFFAAALVVFAMFEVSLPFWIPIALVGGAGGLLALAVIAWRRHPDNQIVQGFSVLMRPRYRWRVLALLALVFAVQIVRTWLALRAVGLHLGLGDAMLVFVLTGVLGVLPSGVSAAPTAASLIVVGSDGVGKAAASGILVTGSLVVATIVYCMIAGAARLLARRRYPLRHAISGH